MAACLNCGANIIGPPGSRRVCPGCGRATIVPTTVPTPPPTPTVRSTPAASFSPSLQLTPPGANVFTPSASVHSGPQTTNVPALLALVFGILAWLLALPLLGGADWLEGNNVGTSVGMIGLPLGIAAIVLGFIGLRQCNREPQRFKGRGMAVAGLTLGIVFTTLWLIAVILVLIFCLAYLAAYGKSTAVMAPCPAVAMQHATRNGPMARHAQLRLLLAHHPECGAFRSDVVRLAGVRLCASCAAFVASATIAGYLLWLVTPSPATAPILLAGAALLILLPQSLSALRWTTTRVRKMLIKSTMGIGAAILFSALLAVPWEGWTRLALLNGVSLLAVLLVLPRKQRLYDEMAAHEHDAHCGRATA